MPFRLEVTKKHNALGAEMEYVSRTEITLATALEMIVLMFCSRRRRPVLVTEFDLHGVAIFFPVYIGTLGPKPIILPDQIPGYSGGFGFRFKPFPGPDYDQLNEMISAYLIAYPDLASYEVNELMERVKAKVA